MRKQFIIPLLTLLYLSALVTAVWGVDRAQLLEELQQAGFAVVGEGSRHGVDFIAITLPKGMAIYSVCRKVPSLQANFVNARDRIAVFNALNPFYARGHNGEPFETELTTLKIPVDLDANLAVFPEQDPGLQAYGRYIIIDITKSYLGVYENGQLQKVYPISSGRNGTGLCRGPQVSFTIQGKDKNHWSSIYETYMPWSLLISSPYFIHGGVLPGVADSAGCIRMFPQDAEELFHIVDVGTPGRIVCSSDVGKRDDRLAKLQ